MMSGFHMRLFSVLDAGQNRRWIIIPVGNYSSLMYFSSHFYILWRSDVLFFFKTSPHPKWFGFVFEWATRRLLSVKLRKLGGSGTSACQTDVTVNMSSENCPSRLFNHSWWAFGGCRADIGLGASAVQIRLALTLNVEKACKPGPCFISPGCITHF